MPNFSLIGSIFNGSKWLVSNYCQPQGATFNRYTGPGLDQPMLFALHAVSSKLYCVPAYSLWVPCVRAFCSYAVLTVDPVHWAAIIPSAGRARWPAGNWSDRTELVLWTHAASKRWSISDANIVAWSAAAAAAAPDDAIRYTATVGFCHPHLFTCAVYCAILLPELLLRSCSTCLAYFWWLQSADLQLCCPSLSTF